MADQQQHPHPPSPGSPTSPARVNYHERNASGSTAAGPAPYRSAIYHPPSLQSLRTPYTQDAYDLSQQLVSPIMSRSPSVASDRYSVVSGLTSVYFPSNPQNVNPAPAYVAPLGATQVVTEHRAAKQRPSSDDEGDEPSKDDVQFSESALVLVNGFIDQLLFSFLSTARSTSLSALKPAVTEVLKARLARDAIASAEEELQELLAGGDEEEEVNNKQEAAENRRKWDLELVWKRTRLRVMVYMRLGELEDDDEERYVKEEELFHGTEQRRFSQTSGLVSWAAAIFLTGLLEYIAEQTLQYAGNAAFTRVRRHSRSARMASSASAVEEATTSPTPVVVEYHDVEKVALHSTLGRLWRTWRKTLRSANPPHAPGTRKLSHETLRRGSGGESMNGDGERPIRLEDVPEMEYPEHVLASNIPLPMSAQQRDVDEIEVPGLARDPDALEKDGEVAPAPRRNSFTSAFAWRSAGGLPTPDSTVHAESPGKARPLFMRQRSTSVPTPARTPMPADELKAAPGAFPEEPEVADVPAGAKEDPVEEDRQPKEEIQKDDSVPAPDTEHDAEPKANAEEMAVHKQSSGDVTGLLDKVVEGAPPEDTEHPNDKESHPGVVGAALAGASAIVAAAGALVYGARSDKAEPDEASAGAEATAEAPEEIAEHSSGAQKSAEVVAAPTEDEAKDVTKDVPKGEDFDDRKSLMDMKVLLAEKPAVKAAEPWAASAAIERPVSEESEKSYTLGHRDAPAVPQQSFAKRQTHTKRKSPTVSYMLKGEDIGVARTSHEVVVVSSPTVVTAAGTEDLQQARDESKRPSRLILGGTPPRNVIDGSALTRTKTESPKAASSPKGAREFLESRSLPSGVQRTDNSRPLGPSPASQQRAQATVRAPQKRMSIPGLAFTSALATPVAESDPHRQSWSAALQQQREQQEPRSGSVPSVPTVPAVRKSATVVNTPVKEHPVIQRMASLKRSKRKSDSTLDSEPALTSASIRGPEDFDMFVQGAETVKYTLTPESARITGKPQSPVELSSAPSVMKKKKPSAPPIDTNAPRAGRSQAPKHATSALPAREETEAEAQARKKENRRSTSRPETRNTTASRRSGFMAREPRVATESTRDFADFIRSTGPSKEAAVTPILNPASRSVTSLHSLRSAHINGASHASSVAVRERTRSLPGMAAGGENVPPVPPMPTKSTQTNIQPRAAKAAGDGNAELIDFIRTGPNQVGEHRISRTVAPFRSTMDSDQLRDIGDSAGKMQPLKLDTNVNGASPQPSNGVANSNNAAQTVHPAHSGQPQTLSASPSRSAPSLSAFPSVLPTEPADGRKRYRNKDPYAIDTDDEDDLLTALPKGKRQEESLMDFLNNTEPPRDNAPTPLVNGGGAQPRGVLNRSRSGKSLIHTTDGGGRTKSIQSPTGPRPGTNGSTSTPLSRITSSTASRRPKMEAKSPGDSRKGSIPHTDSSTRDMIDFFKTSGPPDPGPADPKSAPAPSVGRQSKLSAKDAAKVNKRIEKDSEKTEKKKRSFFSRKKTWLDMP